MSEESVQITSEIDRASPVMLTGASGFVGSHVLRELLRHGHRVHALVHRTGKLKVHDRAITEFAGSITDPQSLAPALAGCRSVIHLVGIIKEKRQATFERIHVEGTRNLLAASKAAGTVERFVHMSALGSRPNAPARYHQSKWAAEELVRHAGIPFVIFRPSLIHGPDGEFTMMLRNWSHGKAAPYFFMPYFGSGFFGQRNTHRIQPVHVDDVAMAFAGALTNDLATNHTYDIAGPSSYSWPDMLYIASMRFRGKPKRTLGIPVWYAKILASLPLPLPFNKDQILMSQEDNTADIAPLLRDFSDLAPKNFEASLGK